MALCAIFFFVVYSFAGSSTIFPKNRADEFFKRWRQRKTTDNLPWGDAQLDDANHEILEEMGFPPLFKEGKEVPRGLHVNIPSPATLQNSTEHLYSCTQYFQIICRVSQTQTELMEQNML
jgi:hypothetical protein